MTIFRRLFRRDVDRNNGQALAELAIAIPVLLLLLFGIIEFGNAWRTYQVVTNAAREGARRAVMANAGVVDSTEAGVRAVIDTVLTAGGLDAASAAVAYGCDGTAGALCTGMRGAPEEVRIDYPHQFLFIAPIVDVFCVDCGDGGFGTITLSASSVMRSEG
jgi:hypothetical protein